MKKILFVLLMLFMMSTEVHAATLTETQQERADIIAQICMDNWEEYGCLPSVCIGQAIIESGLGNACITYNYWGIGGGYIRYETLEDGVYGYMECINNGYYRGAPFCEDYHEQIQRIVNGGYCTDGAYVSKVTGVINNYELYKYDEEMFQQLENERKLEDAINHINYLVDTKLSNTLSNLIGNSPVIIDMSEE